VKILSHVPNEQEFRFYTALNKNTGESAASLEIFAQKLEEISIESVKFHFQRGDFQEWIQHTVGDNVLAEQIHQTSNQNSNEDLREKLLETIKVRIEKLKRLHSEIKTSQIWESSIKRPSKIRK
jgi:hypothetical protein